MDTLGFTKHFHSLISHSFHQRNYKISSQTILISKLEIWQACISALIIIFGLTLLLLTRSAPALRLDITLLNSPLHTRKWKQSKSHPLLLSIWFCALRPLRCARIPASIQSYHGDLPRSRFIWEAQSMKIYCLWTRFGLVPLIFSSASMSLSFSAQHQWHLLWPFPIFLI